MKSFSVFKSAWLVSGATPETIGSHRVMAFIPAARMGGRVTNVNYDPKNFSEADVVVANKPFDDNMVNYANAAKEAGAKLVYALCDLHPLGTPVGERSSRIIKISDAVCVQTHEMAKWVTQEFGVEPEIIPELLEYPPQNPHFPDRLPNPLRVLWYGSASNHDTLPILVEALSRRKAPAEIILISNAEPKTYLSKNAGNIAVRFLLWSRPNQYMAFKKADIVCIPSFVDRLEKQVKGPNRLTEALNAGTAVVASRLPQYEKYSEYGFLTDDINAGIDAAFARPASTLRKITQGQQFVIAENGVEFVCSEWERLFHRLKTY